MERNMKPAVKSSGRCTVVPVLATVTAFIRRKTMNGMVHPAGKAGKWQQMKNLF